MDLLFLFILFLLHLLLHDTFLTFLQVLGAYFLAHLLPSSEPSNVAAVYSTIVVVAGTGSATATTAGSSLLPLDDPR